MQRIPLAIVGCGGMGGRHLRGLAELYATSLCNVELVGVCDLRRDKAERLGDLAEDLLGRRPHVFDDLEAMARALPDLQAVDVTTDSGSHHRVVDAALDLGLHVMCEKPLASTIRGCNLIIAKHQGANRVLSVAEQFRRDPICRLMKALLDTGAIGEPRMMLHTTAGSGNRIIIFPWRHIKNVGGIFVDAGVHTTDLMQYYLGDVREVYAQARIMEPIRRKSPQRTATSEFYDAWYDEMPDAIEATAEDTVNALLTFESGALGQWTSFQAAHGEGHWHWAVYGARGSLRTEGARNGRPLTLHLDGEGAIPLEKQLDLVPDWSLDAITAAIFGAERMASYNYTFAEADRKLAAVEYHELGECILTGKRPEVDAYTSRRSLAVCHAALESALLHRPVTIEEIEAERTRAYEAEICAHWGI